MRSDLDDRSAAGGARRSLGATAVPAANDGVVIIIVAAVFFRRISGFFIIVGEVTVEIGTGGVGSGVNKSEDGIVLSQSLYRVPDGGHVAAPRAGERRIGGRGEHPGETVSAKSMAALEQKWDSVFLVVSRLANRTAGDFHILELSIADSARKQNHEVCKTQRLVDRKLS